MSLRVAVLMGGQSSEHEVSLDSASGVRAALLGEDFDVLDVLIAREGAWLIDDRPVALVPGLGAGGHLLDADGRIEHVDAVFPVLHGPYGEDGSIQGLCEAAGVPYVGAAVAASAIAMDKVLFKMLLRDVGIPTADFVTVSAARWAADPETIADSVERLGYPVFAKPARLGSSVGISRVTDAADLAAAIELGLVHDSKVLVEKGIAGRELEVGLLGNGEDDLVVSPPGEIRYAGEWYDYETKYTPGRAEVEIPAEVSVDAAERLRDLARRAYLALECSGMARVDFFLRPDGTALMSELNTIPGFTQTSAYPRLMEAAGVGYGPLVGRLVDLAVQRSAAARALEC